MIVFGSMCIQPYESLTLKSVWSTFAFYEENVYSEYYKCHKLHLKYCTKI